MRPKTPPRSIVIAPAWPKTVATVSWWTETPRDGFLERAQQEEPRMRANREAHSMTAWGPLDPGRPKLNTWKTRLEGR